MAETTSQHPYSNVATPDDGQALSADVVRNNINNVGAVYNTHDSDTGIHVQSGTLASRPAATSLPQGAKWLTYDISGAYGTYQLWYNTGAAWKEVTATTFAVNNGQPTVYSLGTVTGATAIDWRNGPVQRVVLGAASITFTMSNPVDGGTYTLILVQDGTGSRGVSLPANWDFGDNPPTYNTTANKKNVISAVYDGTSSRYYAAFAVKGAS